MRQQKSYLLRENLWPIVFFERCYYTPFLGNASKNLPETMMKANGVTSWFTWKLNSDFSSTEKNTPLLFIVSWKTVILFTLPWGFSKGTRRTNNLDSLKVSVWEKEGKWWWLAEIEVGFHSAADSSSVTIRCPTLFVQLCRQTLLECSQFCGGYLLEWFFIVHNEGFIIIAFNFTSRVVLFL